MKKISLGLILTLCMVFTQMGTAQNNAIYPANSLTPGSQNSTLGRNAGASLITGSEDNTLLGVGAGFREEQGDHNTVIGGFANVNVVGGFENTTLGYYAGSDFTAYASKYNVNLGAHAGAQVKGDGNVFIGWRAGENAGNFSQKLYINSGAGTPLIFGDFTANRAGINTTTPISTFDVVGSASLLTDAGTTADNLDNNRAAITGATDGSSCKLYGFRAQTSAKYLVTMGMDKKVPTILWGEGDLNFNYRNTASSPCSKRLLRMGSNVGGSGLQLIFEGSGLVTGSWTVLSDRKVKQNIQSIPQAIDLVKQLNGVSYEYNAAAAPDKVFPQGRVYGFIAQEVQKVIPEVTTTIAESELIGIKYTEIIPLLTEAVKEQQTIIDHQNEKITALEDRLQRIEAMLLGTDSAVAPANKEGEAFSQTVVLGQNRPNPFAQTTTIDYVLPANIQNAHLAVFDLNGKIIQRTNLSNSKGSVTLDASQLGNGTYVYTLSANGQNLATKIMLIQK